MRYREYAATPRCARLVEKFWFLDGRALGAPDAIIPDGRIELIFHYGGAFWRHRDQSSAVRQPATMLVGQMIEPVVLAPEGIAGVAAIRVRPWAARNLLRFHLDEVVGSFVDLALIFPAAALVAEQIAAAATDSARIQVLEDWLLSEVRPVVRPEVEGAVEAILQSSGRMSVDTLSSLTGLGSRQLERQFQADVGLSPKMFSRIVRLQAALRAVREGSPLADVALGCGFYDQAHMTRDFRQLAAMSPGAWQSHAGDLAPLFVGSSES